MRIVISDFDYFECKVVAECFKLSGEKGYNSEKFAEVFMTSAYGVMVITDGRPIEYSGESLMLEGFERYTNLKKGKTLPDEILWFSGFLYKYWVVKGDNPRKIYKLAPIELIAERFNFYHTQGWDYIIEDIKDRPFLSE